MRYLKFLPLFLLCGFMQNPGPAITGGVASQAAAGPSYSASTYTLLGGSGAASVTTATGLAVTAGDIGVFICRQFTSSTTFSGTDSSSDAFSSLPAAEQSAGSSQVFYKIGLSASTSMTFTCNSTVTTGYLGISAVVYHPGFVTTELPAGSGSGLYTTSPTFSTTAKGMIVMCGDSDSGGTVTAGLIGGVAATLRNGGAGYLVCEEVFTTTAQSSITAALTNATSVGYLSFQ